MVPIDNPDTLPIIFERGLTGMYHDWCESFSTYPRTYDLLHADHLFADLKKRFLLSSISTVLRSQPKYSALSDSLETSAMILLIQFEYDILAAGATWWQ